MNSIIETKIQLYPDAAQYKFRELRTLIYEVAKENEIAPIEEALKWGEPSYLTKSGSTIRIDWKPKNPKYIGIYFNCKTNLVETYKELFFDIFEFQTNRAIILKLDNPLPEELKTCFFMALNYHKLKHLPLLGA